MPLPKGVQILPDEVRAMLDPGEVALAWELASSFAQASQIGGTPKADVGFDANPVLGGITVNQDWIGGKLTGYSAGGAPGSLGHQFERAISETDPHSILLTNRRFGLVAHTSGPRLSMVYKPAFSVDRRAVQDIRLASRMFVQRGRVQIGFADGSWAMAMMGMFRRTAARRLIDAFHSGRPR